MTFYKGVNNELFDEAVQMALARHGEKAQIVLMRNGSDIIPRFER